MGKEGEKEEEKSAVHSPLILYVDGGCSNNGYRNSRGGIGIFHAKDSPFNRSERLPACFDPATNEKAELYAAIRALKMTTLFKMENVEIRSDSEYLIHGMLEWIQRWKRNGWITANRKPVKNKELWIMLESVVRELPTKVTWTKVKGHSADCGNEWADDLAQRAVYTADSDNSVGTNFVMLSF